MGISYYNYYYYYYSYLCTTRCKLILLTFPQLKDDYTFHQLTAQSNCHFQFPWCSESPHDILLLFEKKIFKQNLFTNRKVK